MNIKSGSLSSFSASSLKGLEPTVHIALWRGEKGSEDFASDTNHVAVCFVTVTIPRAGKGKLRPTECDLIFSTRASERTFNGFY